MSKERARESMFRGVHSRRRFMGTMACAGAALAAPKVMFARSNDSSRPNFLWIDVEDMSPHLGCYGYGFMDTPRLDQLAEEGVRYVNFGGPHCICGPNRASFITGMYPTTVGAHNMRCDAVEDPTIKLLPDYFRAAGYFCANNKKTDYNGLAGEMMGGQDRWDQFGESAHYRNRPSGSNFWFERNWGGTHESQCMNPRENPRADMELPPYLPDTPTARAVFESYLWNVEWMDFDGAGGLLDGLDNDGLADDTIVIYFGDHGMGMPRAKRHLYDSGLIAPLIVRIPERFRVDGQGEPGTVSDELACFMDLAPTMLNLAGIPIPSYMQGRAFLGPDLIAPRDYLYGIRDRADERYELIRMVRDKRYKYLRNYEPWKEYYQYIAYAEDHGMMKELRKLHADGKLEPEQEMWFAENKPLEELYDLQNDPHELRNLAGSAAHKDVLERMRAAHEAWELETHDLGFIPEGILDERAVAAGSHYKVAMRNSGAESKRAWEAAQLLAKGKDGLGDLVAAMDDSDDAVRYWAAIGLGNLLDDAQSARPKLEAALNDSSPTVRVAAARSLAFMGDAAKGIPKLVAEAKNTSINGHVRLLALNFIDRLGKHAKGQVGGLADTDEHRSKVIARINATIDDDPQIPGVASLPVASERPSGAARRDSHFSVECAVNERRVLIRSHAHAQVHAALYDANGRRVCADTVEPGSSVMLPRQRRTPLPPGAYLVRVEGEGIREVRRVSIQ